NLFGSEGRDLVEGDEWRAGHPGDFHLDVVSVEARGRGEEQLGFIRLVARQTRVALVDVQGAEGKAHQTGIDPRFAQCLRLLEIAPDLEFSRNFSAEIRRADSQETVAVNFHVQL